MTYNAYEQRSYVWVLRTLDPKSEKDKKSLAHALNGYGYYVMQEPDLARKYYVVAYKHFGGVIPNGNELATPSQTLQLDKLDGHRYWRERDHR